MCVCNLRLLNKHCWGYGLLRAVWGEYWLRLSELLQVYTECRVSYGGVALTTIWVNAKKLFFEDIWLNCIVSIKSAENAYIFSSDFNTPVQCYSGSYIFLRWVEGQPRHACWKSLQETVIPHPPYACQLAATLHFTSWYNFANWQKFLVSPAGKIIPAGLTFTSWQLSEII